MLRMEGGRLACGGLATCVLCAQSDPSWGPMLREVAVWPDLGASMGWVLDLSEVGLPVVLLHALCTISACLVGSRWTALVQGWVALRGRRESRIALSALYLQEDTALTVVSAASTDHLSIVEYDSCIEVWHFDL